MNDADTDADARLYVTTRLASMPASLFISVLITSFKSSANQMPKAISNKDHFQSYERLNSPTSTPPPGWLADSSPVTH